MKANKLFLLASFFLSSSLTPIAAQSKKEKKQQTEQAVREAVDAKTYKINVFTGNTQIHVPKEIGILFHGVCLVKILGSETGNRRGCRERFE